jgi:predicted dehydrogenase
MKSIVLIGCGNIGFRHLQALSLMATPSSIVVVEPAPAAHDRIKAHIADNRTGPHRFTLLTAVEDPRLPGFFDLAVISTDTRHRRAAWQALKDRAGIGAVIFEKVLFPSVVDLDEVEAGLAADGILGFVNCGRRGFPDYRALSRRFGGQGRKVDVTVQGTNFGLASNGVHFLDLAEFLNTAAMVEVSADGLEPGGKPSKRSGYVEVFGTLQGRLSNGASVSLTCHEGEGIAVHVTLAGENGERIEIDEVAARMTEGGRESAFSLRRVSEMTELYEDILTKGTSDLVDYAASARQHRLFLRSLCRHLGLPDTPDQVCPIS